jgi:predicted aspartyl protease
MEQGDISSIELDFYNYPIVPVKFKYKDKKTPVIEALLDSGGDFIVIPQPIAEFLQMKLEPAGDVDTAGGTASLYRANVDMIIGTKKSCTVYKDKEIFVSDREDIPVLLGRSPMFDDYEITFRKQTHQIILKPFTITVHDKYPSDF